MRKNAGLSDVFIRTAQYILPMPFTIAVLLSVVTYFMALFMTRPVETGLVDYGIQVAGFWETGFWELLSFAMQMMLILVLGHVIALSKAADNLINNFLGFCTSTAKAALVVTMLTMMVAFVNWGLGLVFGAVFARKVGEYAIKNNIPLNYPLIGAAGYSGLMVWHGGLSGSAPVIIAGEGHFLEAQMGVISLSETIFSQMNIIVTLVLLTVIPVLMYVMAKNTKAKPYKIPISIEKEKVDLSVSGAAILDRSNLIGMLFGFIFVMIGAYKAIIEPEEISLKFLTLNYINFLLFGLGLILHGNFKNFTEAVKEAISGSTGIMIQFPIYAGIMGMMKYSGLILLFSGFFVEVSTSTSFPIFTFISAAIVNVFVPSGGGQWVVQGPIIIEAAQSLGVPVSKGVMALAYGDQLTNMLQPFWALPLLGITGLQAKDILPYTVIIMLVGIGIFVSGLLII